MNRSYGYHSCRRCLSDRALGYSPMAPPSPSSSGSETASRTKGPTAKEVEIAGGVWAPTSAKKDKLVELRQALTEGQNSLDDAATANELLDLWLADGILAVAGSADHKTGESVQEFDEWLREKENELPGHLDSAQWKTHLESVSNQLALMAAAIPSERCLREVRDFYKVEDSEQQPPRFESTNHVAGAFSSCVLRHRLGLTKAASDELMKSWDELTVTTDADVDRAAVQGISLEPTAITLPVLKAHAVLRSFITGSCSDRVASLWDLLDSDDDGLLDREEMNRAALLSVSPVQVALGTLFQGAVDAYPVRAPLPGINDEPFAPAPLPSGWRERRRQTKVQKKLVATFSGACRKYFDEDVEMPHRLRCIYAWAEKAHQENKIDSVLLDAHGSSGLLGAGRKRYVELQPKIALHEFVEMQQEHFPHLDRVGTEIVESFREDLLVQQGKGRQNRELRRDCLIFLGVVSAIDAFIMWL